jgi:hypothetical protein
MGCGRAKAALIGGLLGATALAVTGCGEGRHANEQRPDVSTRVSVTIGPREVIVQPTEIGTGPDPTQQIEQNRNHPQPPIHGGGPLDVTFVTANQTSSEARLQIRGIKDTSSEPVFAHSPGTFHVDLPAGAYVISAAGIPGARPAHLTVGRYRASSQNDVLLP